MKQLGVLLIFVCFFQVVNTEDPKAVNDENNCPSKANDGNNSWSVFFYLFKYLLIEIPTKT